MPELSIDNIGEISRDISSQEINFSHLLEEFIDHVCCDVEYEMLKGLSFSEAYGNVKQRIGHSRFSEIQKETLFAVDKKYRNMKNTMKITGVAGTILFGLAALFKIQHWPLAGIMMTLGALILSFGFLPASLGVLWKETHNKRRIFLFVGFFLAGMFFVIGTLFKVQHWPGAGFILLLSLVSVLFLFVPAFIKAIIGGADKKLKGPYLVAASGMILFISGMLFKIQHWPGATLLLFSGLVVLGFIALPWYSWLVWREENEINPVFLFLIIGLLIIMIPATMINLNMQNNYESGYYYTQEQQLKFRDYLHSYNSSLLKGQDDSLAGPNKKILHSKVSELNALIGDIQARMVAQSERNHENKIRQTPEGTEVMYKFLSNPFTYWPVKTFLLPGSSTRTELENALNDFRAFLPELVTDDMAASYSALLDPGVCLPGSLQGMSLMSGLHALELLKNSILVAESGLLKKMADEDSKKVLAEK